MSNEQRNVILGVAMFFNLLAGTLVFSVFKDDGNALLLVSCLFIIASTFTIIGAASED
jgi:hypothetical protein